MRQGNYWKDNKDAAQRLEDLWVKGHTSGYIAGQLGVTRNAVISRVMRTGLKRSTSETPTAVLMSARPMSARLHSPSTAARKAPMVIPQEDPLSPPPKGGVSLIDIGSRQCRWVIAMPTTERRAFFCGAGTKQGQCWCEEHRKVGYAPRGAFVERRV
jgi:GcrA cell cycle regulator